MNNSKKQYKLGLVLSGGAAHGFAHIGVLKALQEADIRPDVISGASAGAIVGAFYASGHNPEEILEIFSNTKLINFVSPSLNGASFMEAKGLRKVFEKKLKASKFEELSIPMYVGATNFNRGEARYFHEGILVDKLLASASIPVLFPPVEIEGDFYLDGGIVDNLPFKPLEGKCRYTIGVHVNPTGEVEQADSIKAIAERTFHLVVSADIHLQKHLFSLFIEPKDLAKYGIMQVSQGKKMYEIGYEEAKKVLDQEKDIVKTFKEE